MERARSGAVRRLVHARLVAGDVDAEDHDLDGNEALQADDDAVEDDGVRGVAQRAEAVRAVRPAQRVEQDEGEACARMRCMESGSSTQTSHAAPEKGNSSLPLSLAICCIRESKPSQLPGMHDLIRLPDACMCE